MMNRAALLLGVMMIASTCAVTGARPAHAGEPSPMDGVTCQDKTGRSVSVPVCNSGVAGLVWVTACPEVNVASSSVYCRKVTKDGVGKGCVVLTTTALPGAVR